jgi:ribosome biogenesis protein Tsr3
MKVNQVMQMLQNLDPESEILISYWDKETIEMWHGVTISDTNWDLINRKFDEADIGHWGDDIEIIISDVDLEEDQDE